MNRLQGKRAVVTGAASGIGQAVARLFAQEGASVGLMDVNKSALDELVSSLQASGSEAIALHADVRKEDDVSASLDQAASRWQGLDIVVANAGVQLRGLDARAHELELSVWQETIDTNLTGVFLTCKHGIRALLKSGGGSIVLTGSPTGVRGMARGYDAYTASKSGVHGLGRVLANDYAKDGIRVNVVVPGFTDTPLNQHIITDQQSLDHIMGAVPLGRPGTSEEVASLVLFLASDEASYATGAFFFVDGGLTSI